MKLFAVLTRVAGLLRLCAGGRGERRGRWLGGGRRKGIGDLVVFPLGLGFQFGAEFSYQKLKTALIWDFDLVS